MKYAVITCTDDEEIDLRVFESLEEAKKELRDFIRRIPDTDNPAWSDNNYRNIKTCLGDGYVYWSYCGKFFEGKIKRILL